MKYWNRVSALILSGALLLMAAGCSREKPPEPTASPEPVVTPEPTATAEPTPPDVPSDLVRLGLTRGLSALSAVGLWEEQEGPGFEMTLAEDPAADLLDGLRDGSLDLAVLPANLAAILFNEDGDSIRLLGLTARGGLKLLERGSSVYGLPDLKGRTLCSVWQGSQTEYVLAYLTAQIGMDPQSDFQVKWYTPEDLRAAAAGGEENLFLVPSPMGEELLMETPQLRAALDFGDLWEELAPDSPCMPECLVARTDWLKEHGALVPAVLDRFADSADYVGREPAQAAEKMEQAGLTADRAAAEQALAAGRLLWSCGEELLTVSDYYASLFSADPESIGGAIPDDTFYYLP